MITPFERYAQSLLELQEERSRVDAALRAAQVTCLHEMKLHNTDAMAFAQCVKCGKVGND